MKTLKKYLEFFKSNSILIKSKDGNQFIAIKPICSLLEVDYNTQFYKIKSNPFLASKLSLETFYAADGRRRKMICLPEFFIYTWILNVNSKSSELQEFQFECYGLLYEHFKGTITNQLPIFKE
jgi:hypothetical protein